MHDSTQPLPRRYYLFVLFGIFFALLFTLVTSVCFKSRLPGISAISAERVDFGWTDENGISVGQLPCRLDSSGNVLVLSHDLSGITSDDKRFFVFQTRYESIRIWADDILIYATGQTEKDALGSRWHFVPAKSLSGASQIRVEFTRYEEKDSWKVSAIFLDCPGAVLLHLLCDYAPAIIFSVFGLMFTFLLLLIIIFMAKEKIPGIATILNLAAFTCLSSLWTLLDSKITTLFGGNYALTYFFSYCAFYLLMVPFLLYIQQILDCKNRLLRYLPYVFIGNAIVCMGLHFSGLVSIQHTTISVHILLVISMLVSTWELFQSVVKKGEKKTRFTFFGVLFLYVTGLASIILYNTGVLRPTNNALPYSWALLILIFCMAVDEVFSLRHMWKQKQYSEYYRKMAVQDSMTLLENRNAYELHLQKLVSNSPHRLTFILFDVDNLKMINDTYGHFVGDQIIYLSAQCIREVFEPVARCYRIGGDEFCAIMNRNEDVSSLLSRFEALFKSRSKDIVFTTISYGWKEKIFDGKKITREDIAALQKEADENLYYNKKKNKADSI